MKTVFVVGSKPNPEFPNDITPDVAYLANSATLYSKKLPFSTEKVGLVSEQIFTIDTPATLRARQSIESSPLDRLVLICAKSPKKPLIQESNKNYKSLEILTRNQVYIKIKETTKNTHIIQFILRENTNLETKLKDLKHTLAYGLPFSAKISTGIIGLTCALTETKYQTGNRIFVIGIGLDPKSHHFNDTKNIYGTGHLNQDRWYLSNLHLRPQRDLIFTDPTLERFSVKNS